ncbi:AI-2E family transporter [Leptolyngbya sp. FACHB-261]|nr:AI-2E family transporter [Leptolyngbya sp. FACHB-261]
MDSGRHQLIEFNARASNLGLPLNLDALVTQINDRKAQLQNLFGEALGIILGTFTKLLDVLLIVVLTFYLLQYGNQLWSSLIEWLPDPIQRPFSQLHL